MEWPRKLVILFPPFLTLLGCAFSNTFMELLLVSSHQSGQLLIFHGYPLNEPSERFCGCADSAEDFFGPELGLSRGKNVTTLSNEKKMQSKTRKGVFCSMWRRSRVRNIIDRSREMRVRNMDQ